MLVYYNDSEPFVAEWLRNLIAAGLLPAGDVDERKIEDVQPDDLRPYHQCHFFAGIGGWPLALRLAGWPPDAPVWTGSCPCQPFSVAGKRAGAADPRHLWPHFYRLIRAARPRTVMGEQVAGASGVAWLDGLQADLESENYSVEACVLPACSVGAPHVRDRIYWCAYPNSRDINRRHSPLQVGRIESESEVAESFWGQDPQRAIKSGIPVVAYGIPFRMERCCAAGNAIVPQVAAEFVRAWMETRP